MRQHNGYAASYNKLIPTPTVYIHTTWIAQFTIRT